ncbi:BON domain-containing protein [Rhizobium sp. ARZ01]|uniref:BON domain-containing protein n=1 Tax=Rhizobium sp. ARZ01 TaxID=2769313 RepID=UPI00177EC40B|nr:BON domain-containing protein [Rhizobium sp. ARZ01]MBD9375470.1 BON domain-containing protein [Rhizobium sp. ARZ01]
MVFKPPTFHGEEFEPEDPRTRAGLEERVANALAVAGNVDASDIQVTLVDETIVLTGTVLTEEERRAATAIAATFDGVKHVDCRIQVNP